MNILDLRNPVKIEVANVGRFRAKWVAGREVKFVGVASALLAYLKAHGEEK